MFCVSLTAVFSSVVEYSVVECSVVECSTVECSVVECSVVDFSVVECSVVECSVVGQSVAAGLSQLTVVSGVGWTLDTMLIVMDTRYCRMSWIPDTGYWIPDTVELVAKTLVMSCCAT